MVISSDFYDFISPFSPYGLRRYIKHLRQSLAICHFHLRRILKFLHGDWNCGHTHSFLFDILLNVVLRMIASPYCAVSIPQINPLLAKINLLLTECEGRTGEYWPEVVAVRTERREIRTKTTEG